MTMDSKAFDHYIDQLIETRNLTISADARSQWWDAFEKVETPVFKEAITRMISEDESYPTPARVRGVCQAVMNERLSRAVQPPPPSGLTQEEYSRWEREWRRQIVRGESPERAQELALEARHTSQQMTAHSSAGAAIEGTIMNF